MTKMKKDPKQIVRMITPENDKFVIKNDYKIFLNELQIMKVNQVIFNSDFLLHSSHFPRE